MSARDDLDIFMELTFGIEPHETAPFLDAYRDEIRLATLREVRKAAIALDRDPKNDDYLWGYGGGEICKMLGNKVREARGES